MLEVITFGNGTRITGTSRLQKIYLKMIYANARQWFKEIAGQRFIRYNFNWTKSRY